MVIMMRVNDTYRLTRSKSQTISADRSVSLNATTIPTPPINSA